MNLPDIAADIMDMPEAQKTAQECYGDLLPAGPRKRDIQFNLKSVYEDGIYEVLSDFLDLEHESSYDVLFCWLVGTFCYELFDAFPYLYFVGTKRSGKSRALIILNKLANHGVLAANSSPAALYHYIEETTGGASLFFDELENLHKEGKEDLKLILQAGYRRGESVLRCVKDDDSNHKARMFNTYCPKAIASISRPDDVLGDRALVIEMRRSINIAVVNRYIPLEEVDIPCGSFAWAKLSEIIRMIVDTRKNEIKKTYSALTDKEFVGRGWEMWRPLLAIAQVCLGPDYFDRLRAFAITRVKEKEDEEQFNLEATIVPALYDLTETYNGRVPAAQLLVKIKQDDTYSWVNAQFLGRVLRNIGFKPLKCHGTMFWLCPKDKIELLAERLSIKLKDKDNENEGM